MINPKIGRPKGKVLLKKADILATALQILDEAGTKGLSMRSLAQRLNVTPMALYNHVADRSALIRELSDTVYSEVSRKYESSTGSVRERLELLLITYHKTVLRHPNLSLSIFESPEAFSDETRRITNYLLQLLKETSLTSSKQKLWLNILVDFTHGSSIALAANSAFNNAESRNIESESVQYSKELKELLDCVFSF
jgi:AcrR family transcriptional regulator